MDSKNNQLTEEEISTCLNSEAIDGDEEFLWEILTSCAKKSVERLLVVEDEKSDDKSRKEAAHAVKGSAAMARLVTLSKAAASVEDAFKSALNGTVLPDKVERINGFKKEVGRLVNTVEKKGFKVR